jgi:hypothetical protein
VDPAHAGMILLGAGFFFDSGGGPRACGDDPKITALILKEMEWTPRMRG